MLQEHYVITLYRMLKENYGVASHVIGVAVKVQCYITWPSCYIDGNVTSQDLGVTAKAQCYITWLGCYSDGTMLHHMARVLQLSYSVTSHGHIVAQTLQCCSTQAACYSEFTMLRHMVWVLQKTKGMTPRVTVLSPNIIQLRYDTHVVTVTVHTKSDVADMLWSICWRLPSTLWRVWWPCCSSADQLHSWFGTVSVTDTAHDMTL